MGASSSLDPGDEGYDPERGESQIPSRIDETLPQRTDGQRTYDEMSDAECDRMASIQGWKPLAVYSGPPGGFIGAREFLKRADEQTPIMRAQNRRLTEKLSRVETEVVSLRGTVAEQSQMLTEIRAFARNANEEGYRRARADLEAEQDEAAGNADQAAVRAAREKIRALDDGRAKAAQPAARTEPTRQPPASQEIQDAWEDLKSREPWAGRDPVLTTALIEIDKNLNTKHPDMPVAERFDLAAAKVKRDFPQFFPSSRQPTVAEEEDDLPPARQPAQPTRAQSRPAARPNNRNQPADPNTIASIEDNDDRAQARTVFDRYKRQFPDFTEAEYMAIYRNPKIDARELRQEAKRGRK